jgi:ferredoxin
MGLCGSCWIEVVEGMENLSAPSKMEQLPVPHKAISGARRLSCQTRVYGDCVIRLQDSQQPAE